MRWLIVNADDFGLCPAVNEGVRQGLRAGIVTSASLMVDGGAAADAAAFAQDNPRLSVGLHVDIGEWAFQDGAWTALYARARTDDPAGLAVEAQRQLSEFRRLMGRDPSHIDSHQHAHLTSPLREVLLALADRLGAPLRHFSPAVRYLGNFYGQTGDGRPLPEAIRPDSLIGLIQVLPGGVTELACHPAAAAGLATTYDRERVVELATLCDPAVRAAVDETGVQLVSFADLPELKAVSPATGSPRFP